MTSKELQERLKGRWSTFTPSEQRIATWLLDNVTAIPFETAASLGRRVGVSSMTVGRFLHALGYAGLAELKEELRYDAPWLKFYKGPTLPKGSDYVSQRVQAEIKALAKLSELARTGEWRAVTRRLATADKVSVVAFQMMRFVGLGFAELLRPVRPNVHFADGTDGSYTDLLLDSGRNSCVLLIEVRRYSRHFRLLAEQVVARGIPLVILTDTQCHWARKMTPDVLMMPTDSGRSWHSLGSTLILLSLLLDAVIGELGDVYDRIEDVGELRQRFVGYTSPALPRERESKRGTR